jgi:hypothetical protein
MQNEEVNWLLGSLLEVSNADTGKHGVPFISSYMRGLIVKPT